MHVKYHGQLSEREEHGGILKQRLHGFGLPAFRFDALQSWQHYTIAVRAVLEGGGARTIRTTVLATTTVDENRSRLNIRFHRSGAASILSRCG